jgi:hypothetical protein
VVEDVDVVLVVVDVVEVVVVVGTPHCPATQEQLPPVQGPHTQFD